MPSSIFNKVSKYNHERLLEKLSVNISHLQSLSAADTTGIIVDFNTDNKYGGKSLIDLTSIMTMFNNRIICGHGQALAGTTANNDLGNVYYVPFVAVYAGDSNTLQQITLQPIDLTYFFNIVSGQFTLNDTVKIYDVAGIEGNGTVNSYNQALDKLNGELEIFRFILLSWIVDY